MMKIAQALARAVLFGNGAATLLGALLYDDIPYLLMIAQVFVMGTAGAFMFITPKEPTRGDSS